MITKNLNYEDVADIYKKETGLRARIQPMEKIFKWAKSRSDLFTFENGFMQFKEDK